MRTIGIVRARAKIGLQNLAYNIRRLVIQQQLLSGFIVHGELGTAPLERLAAA